MNIRTLLDNHDVFVTEVAPYSFMWRALTQREWSVLAQMRRTGVMEMSEVHESAFETAYLGEYGMLSEDMPAGLIPSIGAHIMMVSGDFTYFSPDDAAPMDLITQLGISRAQYPASSVIERMRRDVMIAWPGYTPDDLERWSIPKLFKRYAEAEVLLVAKGFQYEGIKAKDITSGNEKPKQRRIDIDAENKALRESLGNQYIDSDVAQRQAHGNKQLMGLTAEQLAKLDKEAMN